MAPIPPSYGKGPSCDLVVEAGRRQPSGSRSQRSRAGGAQESRFHPVGRAPARHRGLLRRSQSRSRRTSMRWRRAAPASPMPTRHARSACPLARHSRPGDGCTRPGRGTTPLPITAKPTSWHHRLREQRSSRRVDRQAAFPRDRRRQRLQRGDPPAACARRHRRPDRHVARATGEPRQHARSRRERGPGQFDLQRLRSARSRRRRANGSRRRQAASDKPWALFVSFVRPHFPLTAPPEFYKLYPPERMAMPRLYDEAGHPRHPAVAALKSVMNYDDFFDDEQIVRRAVASYYALVSFLDHNIGQVLGAIEKAGTDGVNARDLHIRSRRQSRLPRPLGQVGDVRGVGRDPDDHRGRRRVAGSGRRRAGFSGRLLPDRA